MATSLRIIIEKGTGKPKTLNRVGKTKNPETMKAVVKFVFKVGRFKLTIEYHL